MASARTRRLSLPLSKNPPNARGSFGRPAQATSWSTMTTTGSIGRRYRRQDEIGTPLCVTVRLRLGGGRPRDGARPGHDGAGAAADSRGTALAAGTGPVLNATKTRAEVACTPPFLLSLPPSRRFQVAVGAPVHVGKLGKRPLGLLPCPRLERLLHGKRLLTHGIGADHI